jgi:hypothetical protein
MCLDPVRAPAVDAVKLDRKADAFLEATTLRLDVTMLVLSESKAAAILMVTTTFVTNFEGR